METNKETFDIHEELSKRFNEVHSEIEKQSEEYWNSLSKDEQLKVFCAVSRRIFRGELKEKRSYRGVLYGVFEFGPEAYAPAQMAGYLAIHNSIMPDDHDKKLIEAFCKKYHIEDAEEKYREFIL